MEHMIVPYKVRSHFDCQLVKYALSYKCPESNKLHEQILHSGWRFDKSRLVAHATKMLMLP